MKTPGAHRLAIATAGGAAVFGIAIWIATTPADPKGDPAEQPPAANQATPPRAALRFDDTADWVGKLRTRAEIAFVKEQTDSTSGQAELSKLSSLGPLTGNDLAVAQELAVALYQSSVESLAAFQAQMSRDSLRDAHEEAVRLKAVEVALGVQLRLRSGDYIVLPQGQSLPYVPMEKLTFGVKSEGRTATAVFVFDPQSYPAVGNIRAYERSVRAAWIEDLVVRFNALPLTERQQRIERHDRLRSLPQRALTKEDNDFLNSDFPIGVNIDATSFLLSAGSVQ